MCKGTFSTGFSGLVNDPPNRQKLWATPSRRFQQEFLRPYGYCRNHVGTLNGAISSILGAGHGMAERDAAECPSKSVACPRAWVLNSVAKFVYCVQMFAKLGFKVFILCADVCLHP